MKKKIIADIDQNYTISKALMLSMMIYLEVYNLDTIKEEIVKRIKHIDIGQLDVEYILEETIKEIESYYINIMNKEYGVHDTIPTNLNMEYTILLDTYRGICYINSLKSYEYEDMGSKDFRRRAKHILQQINIKNKQKYEKIIEIISNDETKSLKKFGQLKYREKAVGYTTYVTKIRFNEVNNRKLKIIESQKINENQEEIIKHNEPIGKSTDDFFKQLGLSEEKINNNNKKEKTTIWEKLFNIPKNKRK